MNKKILNKIFLLKKFFFLTNIFLNKQKICLFQKIICLPHSVCSLQKKTPGLPSPRQSVEVDCMVSSFQLTIMASPEADPLGILRATIGNMAAVMARISAHIKAMFAILPAGLARHHDPKPAAARRTERFFGEPVISIIGFFNLVLFISKIGFFKMNNLDLFISKIRFSK